MDRTIDEFQQDDPIAGQVTPVTSLADAVPDLIEGVSVSLLRQGADARGFLSELLTTRDGLADPIVHVYQVSAAPGSVRGWVLHKWQTDRLAFTNGDFRVVLYDPRPESPTHKRLNILDLGDRMRCLLHIPPLVVHAVQNRGSGVANFVNMPTAVYHPDNPDKWRLPIDHPAIPYRF